MELKDIAKAIKDNANKIILIFAFNGVGKTQLSVKYKDLTKKENGNTHAGVYYNAYSEDLFQWENDEDHHNENIRLNVVYSSLNQYHSYIIEDQQKLQNNLDKYFIKYYFDLNYNKEDYSNGIESISFYADEKHTHQIKISRGEERIFVWCFFLTLFEISSIADEQNAHFFIDDPVSSLDEHNIHITASTIMDIIANNFDKKKIIITTHHVGLFSILIDRLIKVNGSKYKNLTKTFIIGKNANGDVTLSNYGKDVFMYHLCLYKQIQDNINSNDQLDSFNFVLLRQLLENIASFLGKSGNFSFALSQLSIKGNPDPNDVAEFINEQCHKDVYYYQTSIMSDSQKEMFIKIFDAIKEKYNFHI